MSRLLWFFVGAAAGSFVAIIPAGAADMPADVSLLRSVAVSNVVFAAEDGLNYVARTAIEPVRGYRRGVNPLRRPVVVGESFPVEPGSIELTLQRLPVLENSAEATETDTLFSLINRQGRQILTAYLMWPSSGGNDGQGLPGLILYSETVSKEVWGFWLPFPRQIEADEVFTLKFSWSQHGTAILLNGQPLAMACADFADKTCAVPRTARFAPHLAGLSFLQFGNDAFTGDNSPLDATRLVGYRISSP